MKSLKIILPEIQAEELEEETDLKEFFESLHHNHTLQELRLDFVKTNNLEYLFECLKFNQSLVSFKSNYFFANQNLFLSEKIQYLIDCNKNWNFNVHRSLSTKSFDCCVFMLVCCLRSVEKCFSLKFGRLVLFEIIRRIDRKSFIEFDLPINKKSVETKKRKKKQQTNKTNKKK